MDTRPFTCPYCDTEIALPEDAWYHTCPQCGKRLDITAQFAYLRGLDAFTEGQEIMAGISPRKKRLENPEMQEAIELFREAYSSLQVAFTSANLALAQRNLGVEMMASMSNEFMKLNMVSILEMSYWKSLMVEITAQKEYDNIKDRLVRPSSGLMYLWRIRWLIRRRQLLKALVDLDSKLKMLEKQIEFIDVPRARNENWKP
jgi:hypothetical protein